MVRTSIERFYEAVRAGGQQARTILEESGFVASGDSLVIAAEQLASGRILSTGQRDVGAYRWKNRKPFQNLLTT